MRDGTDRRYSALAVWDISSHGDRPFKHKNELIDLIFFCVSATPWEERPLCKAPLLCPQPGSETPKGAGGYAQVQSVCRSPRGVSPCAPQTSGSGAVRRSLRDPARPEQRQELQGEAEYPGQRRALRAVFI